MRLLIDTHVALWLLAGDRERVPGSAAAALEDVENGVLLSAVCVHEIAVKRSLGKLDAPDTWPRDLTRLGFKHQPITAEHAAAVEHLPFHHRDPFDRLLVAQAIVEEAILVTADSRLSAYDVPVLWG